MLLQATFSSFVDRNSDWISALAIFVVTLLVARLIDFVVKRNSRRLAESMLTSELSQVTVTRLRLVRRLLTLTIVLIGTAAALNQIDVLRPMATTLLASSAVVGFAVGLAARQVLANAIAGLMLAAVQPFRIGDIVEWEERRGRVEDITLSYTFMRLPSGHRLVVPNERIAQSAVENFTIAGEAVRAESGIWVAPDKAIGALRELRAAMPARDVQIGSCDHDKIELKISFDISASDEAAARAATGEEAVEVLSRAGMLGPGSAA